MRRAEELQVQVGRGRELTRTERGDQCRAQGGVEHGGQEAALNYADEIQELLRPGTIISDVLKLMFPY